MVGDFSFALSLALHHHVYHITATCYDSREQLRSKYPQACQTVEELLGPAVDSSEGIDSQPGLPDDNDEEEWQGFSPLPSGPSSPVSTGLTQPTTRPTVENRQTSSVSVHYGIDATKISSAHRKHLRRHGPFTKIVFNFPHVGGLSTDVNRQVRANQELLVNFFNAAKPLLSSARNPAPRLAPPPSTSAAAAAATGAAGTSSDDDGSDHVARDHGSSNKGNKRDDSSSSSASSPPRFLRTEPLPPKGQILITLFEREPYTLWNIRDLARHTGYRVVESFKFPWGAYPGYHHARTAGEIVTGKDPRGAWKGEDRDARCYVFEVKDDDDDGEGGGREGGGGHAGAGPGAGTGAPSSRSRLGRGVGDSGGEGKRGGKQKGDDTKAQDKRKRKRKKNRGGKSDDNSSSESD